MRSSSTETIDASSPEFSAELLSIRVAEALEQEAALKDARIRREFQALVRVGLGTVAEGEEIISRMKARYEQLDFPELVSELTSNFYMWWPGDIIENFWRTEKTGAHQRRKGSPTMKN